MPTNFHESEERLRPATRDMHRAIVSLMEELEAVDWYQQRMDGTDSPELRDILRHNRDEEKEHAAMVLEWIRRQDPAFDAKLREYLFTEGSIVGREAAARGEGRRRSDERCPRHPPQRGLAARRPVMDYLRRQAAPMSEHGLEGARRRRRPGRPPRPRRPPRRDLRRPARLGPRGHPSGHQHALPQRRGRGRRVRPRRGAAATRCGWTSACRGPRSRCSSAARPCSTPARPRRPARELALAEDRVAFYGDPAGNGFLTARKSPRAHAQDWKRPGQVLADLVKAVEILDTRRHPRPVRGGAAAGALLRVSAGGGRQRLSDRAAAARRAGRGAPLAGDPRGGRGLLHARRRLRAQRGRRPGDRLPAA